MGRDIHSSLLVWRIGDEKNKGFVRLTPRIPPAPSKPARNGKVNVVINEQAQPGIDLYVVMYIVQLTLILSITTQHGEIS
jgi:hypothetical protein